VGISFDTPEQTRLHMIQQAGYAFTFLSDPKLKTILRYDLVHVHDLASGRDIARPAEFLLDSSGTIRWRMVTELFFSRNRNKFSQQPRRADFLLQTVCYYQNRPQNRAGKKKALTRLRHGSICGIIRMPINAKGDFPQTMTSHRNGEARKAFSRCRSIPE